MHTQFWFGNLRRRCKVKLNVEEIGIRMWTGFDWIRIGSHGRLL
jgi:hypothetical protein